MSSSAASEVVLIPPYLSANSFCNHSVLDDCAVAVAAAGGPDRDDLRVFDGPGTQ